MLFGNVNRTLSDAVKTIGNTVVSAKNTVAGAAVESTATKIANALHNLEDKFKDKKPVADSAAAAPSNASVLAGLIPVVILGVVIFYVIRKRA